MSKKKKNRYSLNKKQISGVIGDKHNFIQDILNKFRTKKKLNKNERVFYHKHKRDSSYLIDNLPDKNINDVRISAMYHNNCLQKALGNRKYYKSNEELFAMAVNYALYHENKPLGSVKSKDGSYRI